MQYSLVLLFIEHYYNKYILFSYVLNLKTNLTILHIHIQKHLRYKIFSCRPKALSIPIIYGLVYIYI